MREHRFLRQLQNRDCVLAAHRRKVLQEVIEGIPFFKIVEQRLHGHTCPGKHNCSTEDFIRASDEWFRHGHFVYKDTPTSDFAECIGGAQLAPVD